MIRNQWYAILPSSAVKQGKITGVKRLGINLVLFRDARGMLGCITDRCSHRGAALSAGKIENGCVHCPFHGIQFDNKGNCVFIPALGKENAVDLRRFNVQTYMVREQFGIIYLWYGDHDCVTEELPFFYDQIKEEDIYSEFSDHWNSHYSRCIENQLDVIHLPIVHHNSIGRGNKTLVHGPKVIWEKGTLETSANNEVDHGQTPKPPDESVIKETYLRFLFPNIWLNHVSDKIRVLIYFAPVDEENTILYIRFYSRIAGIRSVDRFIAWTGKFANKFVERQDKRVVITQKPKATSLRMGENLLVGDGPIIYYRRIREELKAKDASRD